MDQNTPRRGGRRYARNAKPTQFAVLECPAQGLRRVFRCVCRALFRSLRRERVPHANAKARGANECGGSARLAQPDEPIRCPAVEQVSCARLLGRFVFVACNLPEQETSGADGCDRRFCKRAERGGRTAIFYF
ncbi:hypothetical protein SDC9_168505 [bioreactor metagenome]|uniref:Uncharacterized protein n=1 Tax=bioreactor metagenome TaxID=1076179 RepID=A0A645G4R3_9ZZZZ